MNKFSLKVLDLNPQQKPVHLQGVGFSMGIAPPNLYSKAQIKKAFRKVCTLTGGSSIVLYVYYITTRMTFILSILH